MTQMAALHDMKPTSKRASGHLVSGGWFGISTAPKDGTRFIGRKTYADQYSGVLRYTKRRTWYGKTSHVPLYGWCHGTDVEDIDLWEPTHWRPLPNGSDEPRAQRTEK